jgi:hypothetical protein
MKSPVARAASRLVSLLGGAMSTVVIALSWGAVLTEERVAPGLRLVALFCTGLGAVALWIQANAYEANAEREDGS